MEKKHKIIIGAWAGVLGIIAAAFIFAILRLDDSYVASESGYEIVDQRKIAGGDLIHYYVMVNPIDSVNDSFKYDLKRIVSDMAHEFNTADFIVQIYSSRETLAWDNPATLERLSEEKGWDYYVASVAPKEAMNNIAIYTGGWSYASGKADTSENGYVITWFSAAKVDDPVVGRYVGTEQFNPIL